MDDQQIYKKDHLADQITFKVRFTTKIFSREIPMYQIYYSFKVIHTFNFHIILVT